MEDITDADYTLLKEIVKIFKYHDGYHDLYVQSFILLLVDVFESFRNRCIKTYEFYRARFLIALGLAWQVAFKKTKAKVRSYG